MKKTFSNAYTRKIILILSNVSKLKNKDLTEIFWGKEFKEHEKNNLTTFPLIRVEKMEIRIVNL